jgi:MtN3 and saliva related transmembrane protein
MTFLENAFGYVGGILSSGAMLPQWIRMIRTRSTQDISWAMLSMMLSGQAFWIVHGSIHHDPVIILFCCLTMTLNTGVLATKCFHSYRTIRGGGMPYHAFQQEAGTQLPPVSIETIMTENAPGIQRPGMSRTHSHNLGV